MHGQVECSSIGKLEVLSKMVHSEGWSSICWKEDFSALHLAAKVGSKSGARQLLQQVQASSDLHVLHTRDSQGFTPCDYAYRSMIQGSQTLQEGFSKPEIDLEMLDLVCPDFAADALSSIGTESDDQDCSARAEGITTLRVHGSCEQVLRVAVGAAECHRQWPKDFSSLHLTTEER
jgi:hypothetical protein